MRGIGWQVTDYVSAHGVMIVNVELAQSLDETDIARELVDPLKDGYVEVLVYFRRPGDQLAETRVGWTPGGGYDDLHIASTQGHR